MLCRGKITDASESSFQIQIISCLPEHSQIHSAGYLSVRYCKFTDWFSFCVHVTVHCGKFLIIKQTRCTNFSNLFLE